MAVNSYIRGGASAVKKGISTVGTYMLRPLKDVAARAREIQEEKRKRNLKMIETNFGSMENYRRIQKENEGVVKKRLEAKAEGRRKLAYVKGR